MALSLLLSLSLASAAVWLAADRALRIRSPLERLAVAIEARALASAPLLVRQLDRRRTQAGDDEARVRFVARLVRAAALSAGASLLLLCAGGGAGSLACLLGSAAPLLALEERRARRRAAAARAVPFALDLLVLSVEAGLELGGALRRVVERGPPGPLRDELDHVLRSLRVGESREDALRGLAKRLGVPAVDALVSAILQAERMGTPLGRALRVQAELSRRERSQRAEQLAGEAPVRLLFPLLIFVFPTVFLVLFGPLAFQLLSGGWGG